jgi:uncharacterized protein YndB with AHSA1/START domain
MTRPQHHDLNAQAPRKNMVHHVFEIASPPETVFDALTTTVGLAGWWNTTARASARSVGGLISVSFDGFSPQMQVTRIDPPRSLTWQGLGPNPAWGDSNTLRVELEATQDGTVVHFWHELGAELNDFGTTNFNWGYYLDSLRLLCETGAGKPFRAGVAGARAGAS